MKTRTHLANLLVILALFTLLFPAEAHAYLDPGTGSYILQIVLAALVGTLFAVRLFWGRIKSAVRNLFSKQEMDDQDEA